MLDSVERLMLLTTDEEEKRVLTEAQVAALQGLLTSAQNRWRTSWFRVGYDQPILTHASFDGADYLELYAVWSATHTRRLHCLFS